MSPERIQRKRTPGWRTPECSCGCGQPARYVGRPTRWGNPFLIGAAGFRLPDGGAVFYRSGGGATRRDVISLYRKWIIPDLRARGLITELAGHDLSCWCPLVDQYGLVPCHADLLLSVANPGVTNG